MPSFLDSLAEDNRHLISSDAAAPEIHLGSTIEPQEFVVQMDKRAHHAFERVSSGAPLDVHIDDEAPEFWVIAGTKILRKEAKEPK